MTRTLVALSVALTLLVPAALASHATVNMLGIGRDVATTLEDDAAEFRVNGHPLNGFVNRVTYPGGSLGDGGLFLDAMLANRYGFESSEPAVAFQAGLLLEEVAGRSRILLPMEPTGTLMRGETSAWYGWWNDLDRDMMIDDVHDACVETACASDEFKWRGVASNDAVAMVSIVTPRGSLLGSAAITDGSEFYSEQAMRDETGLSGVEQVWRGGASFHALDSGLLVTVQSFTFAGARAASGTPFGYDLSDPAALWDVDRYDALDPDAESLWSASINTVFDSPTTIGAPVVSAALDAIRTVTAITESVLVLADVSGKRDAANAILFGDTFAESSRLASTTSRESMDAVYPYDGKEPNTMDDDFEGRALFGGVGDVWGSGNSYDGFRDGYHYYFNARARLHTCVGYYAEVPTTSVFVSQTRCQGSSLDALDPQGAQEGGRRSTGTIMSLNALTLLWHDLNGDTHVGTVCDPVDAGSFDAERNTCRPERQSRTHEGYDPGSGSDEVIEMCEVSSAKGGTVTLTPIGGAWPDVIILRDHKQPMRGAFSTPATVIETRSDDAPIILRWESTCEPSNAGLSTRDAILFPEGASSVPIRVEASSVIAGFVDHEIGIELSRESVSDVDVLPPSL